MLYCNDTSFEIKRGYKPRGYANLITRDDKSKFSLYVENIKYVSEGYRIVIIDNQLNKIDIGRILVDESGKGEARIDINKDDIDIQCVALTYEDNIPLISYKGRRTKNYEDILLRKEENIDQVQEDNENQRSEQVDIETEINEEELDKERIEEDKEHVKERIEEEIEEDEEINKEIVEEERVEEQIPQEIEEERIEEEKVDEQEIDEERIEETVQEEPQKKKEYFEEKKEEKEEDIKTYFEKEKERIEDKTYFIPRRLKKNLKKYKEVKPFIKDIDDTRWWKININPMSMFGYDIPYLGYMYYLNYTAYSDIGFLAYKYRHYLFGINYDEDGQRKYYVYAIPGKKNEQPDLGETGFNQFLGCKNEDDEYGYWICYIDCKTRLISIDQE